jgi:hypothetical protein
MTNGCVLKSFLGFLGFGVFLFVFSTSGYARMYEEPRSFSLRDNSEEQARQFWRPVALERHHVIPFAGVTGSPSIQPSDTRYSGAPPQVLSSTHTRIGDAAEYSSGLFDDSPV